jgi:hypothetical protein
MRSELIGCKISSWKSLLLDQFVTLIIIRQKEGQGLHTALSRNECVIFEQTEFPRHSVGFTHNPRTQNHL